MVLSSRASLACREARRENRESGWSCAGIEPSAGGGATGARRDGSPGLVGSQQELRTDGTRKPAVQGHDAVRGETEMPKNVIEDEQGQDLIEYTLLLAFVALAAAALFMSAATSISQIWSNASSRLHAS